MVVISRFNFTQGNKMTFSQALKTYSVIVENGPLGTRLKYDYGFENSFDLTEKPDGKKALSALYLGDVSVAQKYHLPIILNAATFRASKNHIKNAGFTGKNDVEKINLSCINFVKQLRDNYSNPTAPIFIGAPLGSMHDAYCVDHIPTAIEAEKYHDEQICIFKTIGVDIINAVTIPSVQEALGIALSAEKNNLDCMIGFILNKSGALLDGTSLRDAVRIIDAATKKTPIGYLITCTHTSIIEKLVLESEQYKRLIGMQPNGSSLSAKELAAMKKPITDSPEIFAARAADLKEKLNLKVIGGCCGTSREHLESICALLSPKENCKAHL